MAPAGIYNSWVPTHPRFTAESDFTEHITSVLVLIASALSLIVLEVSAGSTILKSSSNMVATSEPPPFSKLATLLSATPPKVVEVDAAAPVIVSKVIYVILP